MPVRKPWQPPITLRPTPAAAAPAATPSTSSSPRRASSTPPSPPSSIATTPPPRPPTSAPEKCDLTEPEATQIGQKVARQSEVVLQGYAFSRTGATDKIWGL